METNKKRIDRKRAVLPASILIALITIAAILLIAVLSQGAEYRPQTADEITDILSRNTLNAQQSSLVEAAVSLVGRVPYFWGGKSASTGWDERWNTPMQVKSAGSESTGGTEPFGLDCSGYVSWCFMQTGMTAEQVDEIIGSGTWNQWDKSREIRWKELQVGDIAFINAYPKADSNHIGICVGFNKRGAPYFAHCSSTYDTVVVTPAGDLFRYARRVSVFE